MTTRRIVFLSQDDMGHYVCDDDVALPAFAARDIEVETISWRADADWSQFDAVIVRSTWDYQRDAGAFFAALSAIDAKTRLANSLPTLRWNMDKHYLQQLADNGVATVPTRFGHGLTTAALAELRAGDTREWVIKPTISAGAERTFRISVDASEDRLADITAAHAASDWMWQPFLEQIVAEGEFSLFYFNGHFSHAIVKKPKTGDFRVQEEFGGDIRAFAPEPSMLDCGRSVLAALSETPLYARVDIVRDADRWLLIELELIEPSLYLRTDPVAGERFADAVVNWLSTT
ncbi:MAG: hypothetical protein AAF290_07475 [Pseudomonadota bacterium]